MGKRRETVGVGVIGAGIMGAAHIRLLAREVSGADVVAVHDPDHDRAARAINASVLGDGRDVEVFTDPFALIAGEDVDAVLIASSDETHEPYVLAALAAGKPILCEKPLAPTVEACLRVVAAERELGRRLVTVGFMRRDDEGYQALRRGLHEGLVGTPLVLHCIHRNARLPATFPHTAMLTSSALHEIDIARWLFDDEVVAVTVHRPRRPGQVETGTREPLLVLLELASGVMVDIEVFVNAEYGYDVRCELVGDVGALSLDTPAATALRSRNALSRVVGEDWLDRFMDAYRRELQGWIDGIDQGIAYGAGAWDGYVAIQVADAAIASLRTGRRVEVAAPAVPRDQRY